MPPKHGLAVVQEHAGRRTVVLSGTVAQFNAAFGVDLQRFEHPGGSYRGRVGNVQLPDELAGRVEAVLGLDNRPVAKPHFRTRPSPGNVRWHADAAGRHVLHPARKSPRSTISRPEPGRASASAIIELGGGERQADLSAYFSSLGIASAPKVAAVSVDHGKNHPTGDPNGPDGEVMLDIEVVGAIAPQANIAVYFAPNTDAGFLDAITTAIHDTTNKPSVISISWGGPESSWTAQSLTRVRLRRSRRRRRWASRSASPRATTARATASRTAPITSISRHRARTCWLAGDQAEGVRRRDLRARRCGTTARRAAPAAAASAASSRCRPGRTGCRRRKTSGGDAALNKRGVPDVSGDADPQTGYEVRIDGTDTVIGGTSAVAPLWAGLIARINAANGSPAGLINPVLYANAAALRDISVGNNGAYAAGPGWDACTGLGSPDGGKIAALLASAGATGSIPTS